MFIPQIIDSRPVQPSIRDSCRGLGELQAIQVLLLHAPPPDIGHHLAPLLVRLATQDAMTTLAFFLAFVSRVTLSTAAPSTDTAVCPDGTRVSNEACCAFIPVSNLLCN